MEYYHFVDQINIEGQDYRVLISGKEKQNSKKLYSLNIEILSQKNGNIPGVNEHSLNGILPSDMSISNQVKNINLYNYDTQKHQTYNESEIKYSIK